jgi:hypothetical protein
MSLTRGAPVAARVGVASIAYAATAFVPLVPAAIGLHILPAIDPALGSEADVYDQVTTRISRVMQS